MTFQQALDSVESLPVEQQEDLLQVVQRRLAESRRQSIAQAVRETRNEYSVGHTKSGTVDDLLKDLDA